MSARRQLQNFVVTSLMVLSVGCAHVLRITQAGKSLDGVPFYQKKAVCRQETVYVEPIILITKSRSTQDSSGKVDTESETKAFRLDEGKRYLDQLRKCLAKAVDCGKDTGTPPAPKEFEDVWNDLPFSLPVPQAPHGLNEKDLILASNKVEPSVFVDYQNATYLNGNLPWLGSNEVSFEANEDGSLSKASGKSESKIADLIPIKEGLSAIFHLAGKPAKSGAAGGAENAVKNQIPPPNFTLNADVQFFGIPSPGKAL
jgi:hypothetical protein